MTLTARAEMTATLALIIMFGLVCLAMGAIGAAAWGDGAPAIPCHTLAMREA